METDKHISSKGIRHYSLRGFDSLLCGKWLPLPHPELPDGTEVRDCKTCKRLLSEQGPMITIPISHDMKEYIKEFARIRGYTFEDAAVALLRLVIRQGTSIETLRQLPTKQIAGVAFRPEPVTR